MIEAILSGTGLAVLFHYVLNAPMRLKILFGIKPWKSVKALDCFFCTTFRFVLLALLVHHYFFIPKLIVYLLSAISISKLYATWLQRK